MRAALFRQINRVLPQAQPRPGRLPPPPLQVPLDLNVLSQIDPQAARRTVAQAELHKEAFAAPELAALTEEELAQARLLPRQRLKSGTKIARVALEASPEIAAACGVKPEDLDALEQLHDAFDRGEQAYAQLAVEANDLHNATAALAFTTYQASVELRAEQGARGAAPAQQRELADDFAAMDRAAAAELEARIERQRQTRSANEKASERSESASALSQAEELVRRLRAGEQVDPRELVTAYQVMRDEQEATLAQVASELAAVKARQQPR